MNKQKGYDIIELMIVIIIIGILSSVFISAKSKVYEVRTASHDKGCEKGKYDPGDEWQNDWDREFDNE